MRARLRPGARALAVVLILVLFAVWTRSHSPGRAAYAAVAVGLILLGFRRVLEALLGIVIVAGVFLNTELLFGPGTVWLVARIGTWPAVALATGSIAAFNLIVIWFTRWLEWGVAVRSTARHVAALVPDHSGRLRRGLGRGQAAVVRLNDRLARTPRLVALTLAALVLGPPVAATAANASRAEAVWASFVFGLAVALVFAGVAAWP